MERERGVEEALKATLVLYSLSSAHLRPTDRNFHSWWEQPTSPDRTGERKWVCSQGLKPSVGSSEVPSFSHSSTLLSSSLFFCTCVNKQILTNKVLLQEMKGGEKRAGSWKTCAFALGPERTGMPHTNRRETDKLQKQRQNESSLEEWLWLFINFFIFFIYVYLSHFNAKLKVRG